ncbi:MAG TPA: fumarylacetoacetate hydrolase family protein [Candidatus Acidoferrum sp.]|jgi:2-keto-4-pentenoate hydratase/2-oxohepta-3-ene-1,7-dioic acid hydratase in catechol pathway|nr:fumarylacetoacetate hydrolase family protein [Candidatus Acidoferrum sp.]
MKYCRFQFNGEAQYGLVESVAGRETILRILLTAPEESDGDVESLRSRRIEAIALEEATLLPPVRPSKIVCVGRNYRAHAAELGHEVPKEPLLFFKPSSALLAPGGMVRRPKGSERVDYEGELCVVMGKACYQPPTDEDVRPYILGYTCLNDVTARDWQNKDGQWARAKGFDTSCPVGPVVAGGLDVDPWAGVGVETRVNGVVRQSGNTRDFIFTLDVVIRYIAQVMTLFPGDLIATGTPEGVGPLVAGDVMEIRVEGVGTLRNSVVDE